MRALLLALLALTFGMTTSLYANEETAPQTAAPGEPTASGHPGDQHPGDAAHGDHHKGAKAAKKTKKKEKKAE